MDAFWNNTIDRVRENYEVQGAEVDITALTRLRGCLSIFSEVEDHLKDGYCPMIFDSWNCWNESKPGTIQMQPCPNFPELGFSAKSKCIISFFFITTKDFKW